ncbi:hypothetical protein [Hephaestia mangrovi]|jgi:hypothetical protein|uniref:hypothetical protein n=1 Tax=Hephaestia mangrovi TaxID=2873268 RepID=UPI001CA68B89|nr:hypothetical protein [Hephaestia mangrovi]MBY8828357.1 hypothetical protein [Hephaestia mangrovi]
MVIRSFLAAVAFVLGASAATAQTVDAPAATAPDPAASHLFSETPLDEAGLAHVSGRDGTPTWVSANSSSNATVGNNSVGDQSPTGTLAVSDNAFQNVSGISMVNLNTGNNSAINASMNINVLISQAPVANGGGM